MRITLLILDGTEYIKNVRGRAVTVYSQNTARIADNTERLRFQACSKRIVPFRKRYLQYLRIEVELGTC